MNFFLPQIAQIKQWWGELHPTKEELMDFGQWGVILRLGEVRRLIRKPYIHS